MISLTEYKNAIEYLKENGADDIVFKELRDNNRQLVIYPPTAANEKTKNYLDAIAEPGSSGALVYNIATNALLDFNKLPLVT